MHGLRAIGSPILVNILGLEYRVPPTSVGGEGEGCVDYDPPAGATRPGRRGC